MARDERGEVGTRHILKGLVGRGLEDTSGMGLLMMILQNSLWLQREGWTIKREKNHPLRGFTLGESELFGKKNQCPPCTRGTHTHFASSSRTVTDGLGHPARLPAYPWLGASCPYIPSGTLRRVNRINKETELQLWGM